MKGLLQIILPVLLILTEIQGHTQCCKKQIDSILDVVSCTNNPEMGVNQAL